MPYGTRGVDQRFDCGGGSASSRTHRSTWFTDGDVGDVPPLFAEHYTADTRAELPFMHLDGPEPILRTLSAAGFVDPAAEPRPDLTLGDGVPYLITATRL